MAPSVAHRRDDLPVIYVRGTHYDVGYDIGRTFASLIGEMVAGHKPLNDLYLPVYNTEEGKRAYRETLDTVTNRYPQYVQEIQGTADGAKVPFYKLFLLHMDDILPNVVNQTNNPETHGCSSVMSNFPNTVYRKFGHGGRVSVRVLGKRHHWTYFWGHHGGSPGTKELLGHNEDALAVTLNRVYIVNATILEGEKVVEKFCSYCYAGYLPGFCMSYNSHGLVYTVNIISAKNLARAKTPRSILTRALLRCRSLRCVEDVLRDCGAGAADAVSINLTFLDQEGDRLFHNIEVAPPSPSSPQESNMSVLTLSPGEYGYHFNRFVRLRVEEVEGTVVDSSIAREEVTARLPRPDSVAAVVNMLADQSHPNFKLYRESGPADMIKTVSTGVFDCVARTWTVYLDNPKTSRPIAVFPIVLG